MLGVLCNGAVIVKVLGNLSLPFLGPSASEASVQLCWLSPPQSPMRTASGSRGNQPRPLGQHPCQPWPVLLPHLPLSLLCNRCPSVPVATCSLCFLFRSPLSLLFCPLSAITIPNTTPSLVSGYLLQPFLPRKNPTGNYGRGHKTWGVFQEDQVGRGERDGVQEE